MEIILTTMNNRVNSLFRSYRYIYIYIEGRNRRALLACVCVCVCARARACEPTKKEFPFCITN
jgi:hypothetical protein